MKKITTFNMWEVRRIINRARHGTGSGGKRGKAALDNRKMKP